MTWNQFLSNKIQVVSQFDVTFHISPDGVFPAAVIM